ncbi:MAG: DUF4199 domain-containing protein [Saprospiraceae bacterium]|nr:DUF4199 domain-containing protein [Saprospiraceae bacterium]
MKKIVLTFGLISGIIVSIMLFITFATELVNWDNGEVIGYTSMIIALSAIFFGIRSYRDKYLGGTINYGKAFLVGLYITIIASTVYVASWMIISNTLAPDFMQEYYDHTESTLRASEMSESDIQVKLEEVRAFQELYKNPWIKIGMTYMEILPIGLLISLISAAILQNRV